MQSESDKTDDTQIEAKESLEQAEPSRPNPPTTELASNEQSPTRRLSSEEQLRRIREHQDRVSEVERANQQKSKELISRESHLTEREQLLDQKLEAFEARQHAQKLANQSKASLLVPVMLLTCIGAGYLAYEQIDQQRQYFQQVKAAEAHVDKLTRVLGLTAEKVKASNQEVASQDLALEQARERIAELEAQLALLSSTSDSADAELGGAELTNEPEEPIDQGASLEIDQPVSDL